MAHGLVRRRLILGKCAAKTGDAGPIIRDIEQLEKLFLELHPNIDDIPWEAMVDLTEESLKNVCDQMLPVLVPSAKNYTYNETLDTSDFRVERTVRWALIPLKTQVPQLAAHAPVIKCCYEETKFFLTHADDERVFEIHCEDADQEIYSLKGGLYRVNFPK